MVSLQTVHRLLALSACLWGLRPASAFRMDAASPETEAFVPPVLGQPLPLIIPQQILHLSSDWDIGVARLRIGPEGRVEDWVPLDLPHYKLVKAFDRAFNLSRFRPAREMGEPVSVELTVTVPIRDAVGYRILSETLSEHIESRLARINPGRYRLVVSPPSRLDDPLEIISKGARYLPVDADGEVMKGSVTVEFYIDPEGVPRLIQVLDNPSPAFAEAALETVSGLRFSPPRRNHNPTVVRARMPILFNGERGG